MNVQKKQGIVSEQVQEGLTEISQDSAGRQQFALKRVSNAVALWVYS